MAKRQKIVGKRNEIDGTYLSRERVRSTFMNDFRAFMEETVI